MKFAYLSLLVLLLSVFIAFTAKAQHNFPDDLEKMPESIKQLMMKANNPIGIKGADDIIANWGSLNSTNKALVQEISRAMVAKNARPATHFAFFYATLGSGLAGKLSATQISQFLQTTQAAVEIEDLNALLTYFNNAFTITEKKALFFANTHQWQLPESLNIAFAYIPDSAVNYSEQGWGSYLDEENSPYYSSPEPPIVQGAVIRIDNPTEINLVTFFDTASIKATKGFFLLSSSKFVGTGGQFQQLKRPEINYELAKYSFDVTKPELITENVRLKNTKITKEIVKGKLEYRAEKSNKYPKFTSYSSRHQLIVPFKEVELRGGISISGDQVSTSSLDGNKSYLAITDRGIKRLEARANSFVVGDTTITANGTRIRFNVDTRDSVVHSSLSFSYNSTTKKAKMDMEKGSFYEEAPFRDSYHAMDIKCDRAIWQLDSNKVYFYITQGKKQVPAFFESHNYYSQRRFEDIQSMYSFHPLRIVFMHSSKIKKQTFSIDELVAQYQGKISEQAIINSMKHLASMGYVEYDEKTRDITLLPKGKQFGLTSYGGKDFDLMSIASIDAPSYNGSLDFQNNNLKVQGVTKVFLHDSLNVNIIPAKRELIVLKNRDLLFNGGVNAGIFYTIGRDFRLNYKKYMIELPQIDSLQMHEYDKKGKSKPVGQLENRYKNTAGAIYINDPNNKSSSDKQKGAKFPILDVSSESYVYFDQPKYLKKAYDRRIFFESVPFTIDSSANYGLDAIALEGTFNTDGMFPNFKETLKIQSDKTLGFKHNTPKDGYSLFRGAGKFYGKLTLDGNGIRGNGEIRYLTTTIKSNDFIFYQDSVVAKSGALVIKEGTLNGTAFPDAVADSVYMRWIPALDSMYFFNKPQKPIELYAKNATLDGAIVIGKKGASGKGKLLTGRASVNSKAFTFKTSEFAGRNSLFQILTNDPNKPAMRSTDVKFNYDLVAKKAFISPEIEGFESNEFPFSQFRTSIGQAVWDVEKDFISMSKTKDSRIEDNSFTSMNYDQFGLTFYAESAKYNMRKYLLEIGGVPYIKVSDSKIIPSKGEVFILRDAEIMPLKDAKIICDTIGEYNKFKKCEVTILSKYRFEGKGLYHYVNSVGDSTDVPFFAFDFPEREKGRKRGENNGYTYAETVILEEDPIKIAPGVLYKGNAIMRSYNPTLELNGYIRFDVKQAANTEWFPYTSNGKSNEFNIAIDKLKSESGTPLFTGLFIEAGSQELYPTFVSSRRTELDAPLFTADGVLEYDPKMKQFRIGNEKKMRDESYAGNVYTYNDSTSSLKFEGKMNFKQNKEKNFQIIASGIGYADLSKKDFKIDAFMQFLINIPAKLTQQMGTRIAERVTQTGASEANPDQDALIYKIADIAGNSAATTYYNQSVSGYAPIVQFVPKLARGIVISNINLQWNAKESAWYSVGKIGVSNIGKTDINGEIEGYVEIKYMATDQVITLYLQPTPMTWYYFSYDGEVNRLSTIASHKQYNQEIELKSNAAKAKPGAYYYTLAERSERATFIKDFNKRYFNKTVVVEELEEEDDALLDVPSEEENFELEPEQTETQTEDDEWSEKPKKEKKSKKSKNKTEENTDSFDDFGEAPKPSKKAKKQEDDGFAEEPVTEEQPQEKPKKQKKQKAKKQEDDGFAEEPVTEEQPKKEKKTKEKKKKEGSETEDSQEEPKKEEKPEKKKEEDDSDGF